MVSSVAMADTYKFNVQMAGYPFDKVDEKGAISYDIFIKEFNSFPWKDQAGKSNGGSEATITVQNIERNEDYFISVIGDDKEYAYLIGVIYPKEIKPFLGLGKAKTVRWLEIYIAEKESTVLSTSKLFFLRDNAALKNELKQLPLFLEQEAIN